MLNSYAFENHATPARREDREPRKADRRIAYTKTALRGALVELMRDQHISRITVKSICLLADVNRSTFYLHYRDQYDLLHQVEQEVLETLETRLTHQQGPEERAPISLDAMTQILEYARENSDLACVLLGETCDFAFRQDIMNLAQVVTPWMDPSHSERVKEYLLAYSINGCIAVAEKWLKDGMVEQPEEIAELILQILYTGAIGFAGEGGGA
ncbi:MAG: TetR/AcrR family transcriptional regulator [Coriobacteriales bacterium]|jgi:AcrR family transcriptional regulator|nr:TetR/AcrR family transcriptional regulator [Coriobacteriales bacterium]